MISAYSMERDRVISILDVRDGRIGLDADFLCPHCHTPMLPAIGKVVRPHFRHRDLGLAAARGCSHEGILHSTAKMVLAAQVAQGAASGQPYWVRLATAIACPERAKVLAGVCRHRSAQTSLDLSSYGPAKLEATRGAFRYDLLFGEEGGAQLAVEITVSSPSSPAKRASTIPVLEVHIDSDDDISKLMQGLNDHDLSITGYGMETHMGPPARRCAGSDCASLCLSYSVTNSGSVRLEEQSPHEASRAQVGRAYQTVVASRQAFALTRFEALDRLTRKAFYSAHAPVRSCLICRHHEIADFSIDGEGPIVCTQDGRRGSVNRGVRCLYFTPFDTIDEAREHRLGNAGGNVLEA